jgi:hypothetical protein
MIEAYHQAELLALESQQAEIWRVIGRAKTRNDDGLVASWMRQARQDSRVPRAYLLGLDAPRTLNDHAIFRQT